MPTYVQADRPLTISTPLERDDLLLVGFSGHEAISQPFEFELELLVEDPREIAFEDLLGRRVTVHLALLDGQRRHFSGLCKSIREGTRDLVFTAYRMQVVPEVWLLGKRVQSRIFQQASVPEILKQVLQGLDVVFDLQGSYFSRDYCVQYRESDLDFAGRLMEEEGIFYFFRHSANGHTMVVADTPGSHPDLPWQPVLTYGASDQGVHGENRIGSWEKSQELRSGRTTLRDHCFELPHKDLEAEKAIVDRVAAGTVAHRLRAGNVDKLEVYDYPGGYAKRFDGVDPGGGDRPADLEHLFEDNQRTVAIRMQQEALPGLRIEGKSTCRHLVSGARFELSQHFNADGKYLLTRVEHRARLEMTYRSTDAPAEFVYDNMFTCIPLEFPFRPARTTPRPFVRGTQTAVVVGPAGEEIFTDKYGRVKVQFFWDRQGRDDAKSSCWIRVGTPWAGKQWGVVHIPRIGQEVLVDFLEGDPDRPIIVGSVYNAETMPPYPLPGGKAISGTKSQSTPGGAGYNEFVMDDTAGNELIRLHGQHDMDSTVENDLREHVLHDRSRDVGNDETIQVGGDRSTTIVKGDTLDVGKALAITAGDSITLTTGLASMSMKKDGTITIQGTKIQLQVEQSTVTLDMSGVSVQGMLIKVEGQVQTELKGLMTQVSGDAMLQLKGGVTMIG